jgi:aspartyl-tRNA(Asn)/glutamyl-tRNA(Gln) amidotransferase subunit B
MFETIIGLEVHTQLNTNTKLFCNCATSFGENANSNVCPVCLGLPGALPVLNKEAVHKSISFGTAVNALINRRSTFERKNYFYPDLPNGYQISQFEIPVVGQGHLDIELDNKTTKTIGITRAHLEIDAGKNMHEGDHSKVDLNRAGTPLLEIVSEPDMRSADEAIKYLKKLHSIVRYLEISDANMQEGSFRCDANVSIRPKGDDKLYTRVEIKNLNSFKHIQKAIEYEVKRQSEAWEDGKYDDEVYLETRLFDVNSGKTRSMRGKEEAADYRYFPDPDLLNVIISDEMMDRYTQIPELPDEKKARLVKDYGIKGYDAGVITQDLEMVRFFEKMLELGASAKSSVTWLSVELLGRLREGATIETSPVDANKLAMLVKRIDDGTISGKAGKEVLDYIMENDKDIDSVIDELGLKQVSDDGAILAIIDEILSNNQDKVEQYKSGKDKLFGFFVGQTMKASKGSANPQVVNKLLKDRLG